MNDPPINAPTPSNHVFLHELSTLEPGSKVRFLCCVLDYDIKTGNLLVEHAYPPEENPPPRAYVDINIVLETVSRDMLSPGAWFNVIGFYRGSSGGSVENGTADQSTAEHLPLVHALIVWDAGVVKVEEYEKTMQASIIQLRAAKKATER